MRFPVTIVGDMRSSCVIQSYIVMGKAFMRHAHNNRWCLRYNLSTSAGLEAMAFPSEYSSTRPGCHSYTSILPPCRHQRDQHTAPQQQYPLRIYPEDSRSSRTTQSRSLPLGRRQLGESVKAKCKRRANLACAGRLSTSCMSHARVHMTCRRQRRIMPGADEGAGTDAKSSC